MRVDGGKSAKVWARRLQNLVDAMVADGALPFALEEEDPQVSDLVLIYKDGVTGSTTLRNEEG